MPDKLFWDKQYENHDTGWDAGRITTPLKEYFDTLEDKDLKILIPGAGNAHEAEYLFKKGFRNLFVLDIAEAPLASFSQRNPDFPHTHLIRGDFFEHEDAYDLVIEQTFFCALDPGLRTAYAEKMFHLLKPGGRLAGLLFSVELNHDKPPFGGSKDEYIAYFRPYFRFRKFEPAYNSIPPRAGNELFINMEKNDADDTQDKI